MQFNDLTSPEKWIVNQFLQHPDWRTKLLDISTDLRASDNIIENMISKNYLMHPTSNSIFPSVRKVQLSKKMIEYLESNQGEQIS